MRAGDLIVWLGIGLVLIGLLVRLGLFSWFGHLPGDIRAEGDRGAFYFPLTSSIVVSIVATILINVLLRIFNR